MTLHTGIHHSIQQHMQGEQLISSTELFNEFYTFISPYSLLLVSLALFETEAPLPTPYSPPLYHMPARIVFKEV